MDKMWRKSKMIKKPHLIKKCKNVHTYIFLRGKTIHALVILHIDKIIIQFLMAQDDKVCVPISKGTQQLSRK